MARKDEILKSFLEHELINTEYSIKKQELPKNLREALVSKEPIIKAIALIIESLEDDAQTTDKALYNKVVQYLNTASL